MDEFISTSAVLAEIDRLDEFYQLSKSDGGQAFIESLCSFINTLKMKKWKINLNVLTSRWKML